MVYLRHLTHFNHRNIGVYCSRPENWTELLWENLKKVGPEDTLIHVGDVAFGSQEALTSIVQRLPGATKILIEGNHDKRCRIIKRVEGWSGHVRLRETYRLEHDGLKFAVTHRPHDFPPDCDANILVHGHVHNSWGPWTWIGKALRANLSVEVWDYSPVPITELVKIYRNEYPGQNPVSPDC